MKHVFSSRSLLTSSLAAVLFALSCGGNGAMAQTPGNWCDGVGNGGDFSWSLNRARDTKGRQFLVLEATKKGSLSRVYYRVYAINLNQNANGRTHVESTYEYSGPGGSISNLFRIDRAVLDMDNRTLRADVQVIPDADSGSRSFVVKFQCRSI